MDPRRVTAIQEWPTPTTFREIQVFLGFANFYRRFIRCYSKMSGPLSEMLKGSKEGKKTGPFVWTEREDTAFRRLRAAFGEAPVLRHFDPEQPIRVETDASDFAMGAILSQPNAENMWHPCAYWSRKLVDREIRYKTHDKELLAIVDAFKHWRHYVEGSRHTVEVLTDHNNLKGFMEVKQLHGAQARWAMGLAAYDFIIKYRAGKTNPADAPSRRPDYESKEQPVEDLLPMLQEKLTAIGVVRNPSFISQREQELLQCIERKTRRLSAEKPPRFQLLDIPVVMDGMFPNTESQVIELPSTEGLREPLPGLETPASTDVESSASSECDAMETLDPVAGTVVCRQLVPRRLAQLVASYETAYSRSSGEMLSLLRELQKDDVDIQNQRKQVESQSTNRVNSNLMSINQYGLLEQQRRIVIPNQAAVRAEIIALHHDDPLAGHFGADRTLELVRRKYVWPKMARDVQEYVKTCGLCQRTKARKHRPYGEMQALPLPTAPWQEITMDFITALPPSKKGGEVFDCILVVVDRYTKVARYLPTVSTLDASRLLDLLQEHIFLRYGFPEGIVSDRGSLFTSAFWSDVCYMANVKRRLSTAFRPQTDGQTERQNQTLEQYLRTFCNDEQDDWSSLLAIAEFAYNNLYYLTTDCSLFYILYSYSLSLYFRLKDKPIGREVLNI